MPANVVGIVYVVLSALCFSAKAIFAKLAYRQGVDASTVLALRMLAAFPFFALAAVRAELRADSRLSPADTIRVVVLGSGGCYLAACLDFLGLQYITASLERLILFLYPTLVVAFRYVLHSERPPPGIRLAIVLSYSGVVLSASQSALWSSSPRAGLGVRSHTRTTSLAPSPSSPNTAAIASRPMRCSWQASACWPSSRGVTG